MTERDIAWTQLFKDKDIPHNLLRNLHANVMDQILAQPVDFAQALLLAQRRRWGLLLGGSILLAGLIFLGLLGFVGTGAVWQFFAPKLDSLMSLIKGMGLIWQEYSWLATGVAIVLLLLITDIKTPSVPKV